MTIPERLIEIRRKNGYNRKQLAEELGRPYRTITNYENGEHTMKDYTIAVAGTGYVGLSIATLLSQNHQVMAVDIIQKN